MPNVKITADSLRTECVPPTDEPQAYYWDTELTGFGCVVGRTGVQTFVASGRLKGSGLKRRVTIGVAGAAREDGHAWTVKLAREEAIKILGRLASGDDPNATRRKRAAFPSSSAPASGPTLRDGVTAHLARMRKKNRAERSLATFENETAKYLAPWLDRPIAELTGAVLVDLHEQIKSNARAKQGTNASNDKGAPLANRVITHVSAAWNSLNKKLEGALGSWNPAKAVDKDVLKPKRERVEDLADYARRVHATSHPGIVKPAGRADDEPIVDAIRRDGLTFALYTGLRSEDVRTVRFDNWDEDEHTLHLPDPKGGEGAAFTIPLSKTAMEILRRRRDDNARDLGAKDRGWAFPARDSEGEVGPIGDLRKQVKRTDEYPHDRFPVEDVHTLRRTWESIAHEEGVSELDQHVLSNHSFGSHNVNATYISQHIDHLAACADKIDAGITRRINGAPTTTKRRRGKHLKFVA